MTTEIIVSVRPANDSRNDGVHRIRLREHARVHVHALGITVSAHVLASGAIGVSVGRGDAWHNDTSPAIVKFAPTPAPSGLPRTFVVSARLAEPEPTTRDTMAALVKAWQTLPEWQRARVAELSPEVAAAIDTLTDVLNGGR